MLAFFNHRKFDSLCDILHRFFNFDLQKRFLIHVFLLGDTISSRNKKHPRIFKIISLDQCKCRCTVTSRMFYFFSLTMSHFVWQVKEMLSVPYILWYHQYFLIVGSSRVSVMDVVKYIYSDIITQLISIFLGSIFL